MSTGGGRGRRLVGAERGRRVRRRQRALDLVGVALVPYPVGWIMGLVGAFRRLRESAMKPGTTDSA